MEKMYYLSGKLIIKIMTTFLIIVTTLFFNEPVLDEDKVLVRDAELRQYTIEFLTETRSVGWFITN